MSERTPADSVGHPRSPHRPADWVGDWSGRRASLTPDRTGLIDATSGQRYTYAELDARARATATVLADHGVGRGDAVAVISRNRPEVVDLCFATGKTGAVLAPLSHRLAPPELATLLDRIDPELLVVEAPFAEAAGAAIDRADTAPDRIELAAGDVSTIGDADADSDSAFDSPDLSPDDPHLLLHTGGSTGTPKETVITHAGIVWNSLNTITAWGLREDDVTPLTFPMFHTGGWNVITFPLFHMGGTVVLAREFDPGQLLTTIEDEGATVLIAVPAVLRMMTEHDAWTDTDLSTLRFAKSGGGPCRESVIETWWDRDVDLSQGYGLTECGPNNFAMPAGWGPEKADSIGVPATHVDARVVDEGEEVDPGTVGELELAGPHAADAYLDNEAETAETFGDGWVSTGDLARVDEEGYYYIEGRKKDMFVSGGENVYPAEVEDAVTAHPDVSDAVVVPVDDEQWGQVGRAVVVGEQSLTLGALREFLNDRLARYKHPRDLVRVDELPRSGPDKIDRQTVVEQYGDG
jgi:fatty-acyl-CoA synthase